MSELFLIFTLIVIILCLFVVLTERKLLAHIQRRFGPGIIGRNGWLQIVVDLLKLINKEFFILPKSGSYILPIFIVVFYIIQLIFTQNFIFGPNLFLFEKFDGLIFYHLIFVLISNIVLLLIGIFSQSKYSLIGVIRSVVHVVSLDIFVTIVYILIIFIIQSGNFYDLNILQINFFFFILISPISFAFLIILLVEAKRAPFDHVETESEVVAGYATEHSSIFLLIFYLAEYMHLIISANHFTIFFLGGWNILNINVLYSPIIVTYYDMVNFFFN